MAASRRRLVEVDGIHVVLVDSITQTVPADAGRIVVTGSHGGLSAAAYAAQVMAALYVFNDAGIGKDAAGIAGLEQLEVAGVAACAVSHASARIGEAEDTLANGQVSAVNATAARLGLVRGMSIAAAVTMVGHVRLTPSNAGRKRAP